MSTPSHFSQTLRSAGAHATRIIDPSTHPAMTRETHRDHYQILHFWVPLCPFLPDPATIVPAIVLNYLPSNPPFHACSPIGHDLTSTSTSTSTSTEMRDETQQATLILSFATYPSPSSSHTGPPSPDPTHSPQLNSTRSHAHTPDPAKQQSPSRSNRHRSYENGPRTPVPAPDSPS